MVRGEIESPGRVERKGTKGTVDTFLTSKLVPQAEPATTERLWFHTSMRWNQMLVRSVPSEIEDFTRAVLSCAGCVRLLCFLARRPRVANTTSDLAGLLGESEAVIRRALETLTDYRAVEQFTVGEKVFFRLTKDRQALARVLAFLSWREQWVQRAHWVIRNLGEDLLGTPVSRDGERTLSPLPSQFVA